ncbi:MAG: sugar kinase [Bacteroidetes bacterium]|nr:sugar kinase [Bacteroidota bacterium]
MSLLIIGSVAFDAIETPFGQTGKIVGGSASYISLASSMFCDRVGLVAVVGEDFDFEFLETLRSRGVDTNGVQVKTGEKSFFWSGKYHLDMNSRDTLITELNVLGDFDPIIPQEWESPDFVMLGNLSPGVQITTLQRLKKRPKLVVMDTMNFWMQIALPELHEVLKMVDLLTINDEEARLLSGELSLLKAARKIQSMGPQYLIIKKGEHGALLFGPDNQIYFCPALPLEEVFDPTGAGDTFAGGFLGYLASQDTVDFSVMKKALVYGSSAASYCIEKFGTERLQEINKTDVESRLKLFHELVAI